MNKIFLIIPIFELHHINSMDQIKFDNEVAEYFKDRRDLNERMEIYENLSWAENQTDYDYKQLMKSAPEPKELPFSNMEIHQYLMQFKLFMEDEEFQMLSDDRAPRQF